MTATLKDVAAPIVSGTHFADGTAKPTLDEAAAPATGSAWAHVDAFRERLTAEIAATTSALFDMGVKSKLAMSRGVWTVRHKGTGYSAPSGPALVAVVAAALDKEKPIDRLRLVKGGAR